MKSISRGMFSVFCASVVVCAASLWLAGPDLLAHTRIVRAAPAATCSVSWNTDNSGAWNTAGNWSTNSVPGASDDVCIDRGSANPVITLATNATIHSLTNNEAMLWTAGTLNAASGVTNTGLVTLAGSVSEQLVGTFYNAGTVAHTGSGTFILNSTGTFNNLASGLYDFQGDGWINWDSTTVGLFVNSGELRKSVPGASEVVVVELRNTGGLINVLTGTLPIRNWGGSGGTFNASPGAVLELKSANGNSYAIAGAYTGSGGGTVLLDSPWNYNIGAPGATFNFPPGLLQWTRGTIQTSGNNLRNIGFIQVSGSPYPLLAGTMNNAGTVIQTGSDTFVINGAGTFNNLATGLYDFQGDGIINWDATSGGVFVNSGTLRKSGGAGSSTVTPLVTVQNQGGTLEALSGTLSIGFLTDLGGAWRAANGATLVLPYNIATLPVTDTAILSGTGSSIPQLNSMTANQGHVQVLGGAALSLGSALSNTGSISIGVSSVIAVNGAYQQGPTATLGIDVGGTPASSLFGVLNSTGVALLDGQVIGNVVNGYTLNVGDEYPVLTFASRTGTVSAGGGRNGRVFVAVYNPTDLALRVAFGFHLYLPSIMR